MEELFTKKPAARAVKEYTCAACGLLNACQSPKIKPYGNFKREIMIVGEAPGDTEDRTGKPWQGKTGNLLNRTCERFGIHLFDDCVSVNAVRCRPSSKTGANRTPTNFEIDCCRRLLMHSIEQYKPKVIILLGNTAVTSVIGQRWRRDLGTISKWRGWIIPDQDLQTWVCPTFHPSFVERSFFIGNNQQPRDSVEDVIWQQDLRRAFAYDTAEFPVYKEPVIDIIDDLSVLSNIRNDFAFDYETTGRKPHAEGHRIISCAVADTADHAYAFMMPPTRRARQPLVDLLTNPGIGKIAQNMKYEHTWSQVRLGITVTHWEWDTMLAAHILDNRTSVTGLKFQTYVNFGVSDYSSEIDPYMKPKDDDNANAINRMLELVSLPEGREKLLKYNAYDAINEYRLSVLQRKRITKPFQI